MYLYCDRNISHMESSIMVRGGQSILQLGKWNLKVDRYRRIRLNFSLQILLGGFRSDAIQPVKYSIIITLL